MKWRAVFIALLITVMGTLSFTSGKSVTFRTVKATDGTFTVQVPSDWQVVSAQYGRFLVRSPMKESICAISREMSSDERSARFSVQGYEGMRQMGLNVPQAVIQDVTRSVSPHLSAIKVISVLFPRLSAGKVQQMKILRSTSATPVAASGDHVQAYYSYVEKKSRGTTPMEGFADVETTPEMKTPFFSGWSFVWTGADAPSEFFKPHQALYERIFKSFHWNMQAVQQVLGTQLNAMNQVGSVYGQAHGDLQKQMLQSNEEFGKALRNCCNPPHPHLDSSSGKDEDNNNP